MIRFACLIRSMARNEHVPEVFELLAQELSAGADRLLAIAKAIRESGMPHALIHGGAARNVYGPALLDWIDKADAEVKMQIRSYLAGAQSNAELQKEKNARQKLAAAKKKPVKKKLS